MRDQTRLSVPYLEAVEEALCFGWIDGVAKRIDSRAWRSALRRGAGGATGPS